MVVVLVKLSVIIILINVIVFVILVSFIYNVIRFILIKLGLLLFVEKIS